MVEFVYMVGLLHADVILGESVHDLRQVTVDGGEDGHAHAEVGCPEEGLPLLVAHAAHIVAMVLHPSR